jgi:hypothetical protein
MYRRNTGLGLTKEAVISQSAKRNAIKLRGKAVSSDGRAETAGKCLARRACSAYLKRSLGTLVQALVCDAGAACCSLRERGPVCFEPKRADEGLA